MFAVVGVGWTLCAAFDFAFRRASSAMKINSKGNGKSDGYSNGGGQACPSPHNRGFLGAPKSTIFMV